MCGPQGPYNVLRVRIQIIIISIHNNIVVRTFVIIISNNDVVIATIILDSFTVLGGHPNWPAERHC
jgi:hypothetical protein